MQVSKANVGWSSMLPATAYTALVALPRAARTHLDNVAVLLDLLDDHLCRSSKTDVNFGCGQIEMLRFSSGYSGYCIMNSTKSFLPQLG